MFIANQRTNDPVNTHLIWTALLVWRANDPCPGAWPVWTPQAQVAGFIKRIMNTASHKLTTPQGRQYLP